MEEIWKDIEGYEGYYQVSSLGRVRKTIKDIILRQHISNYGYAKVHLYHKSKHKNAYVHRLVAQSFIPNPDNLPEVNHMDENKLNNCVDNLEWCTRKYNMNYGDCIFKIKESQSRYVYQYTLDYKLVKIWKSTQEAGRNGYVQSQVSNCCVGNRKTHKGYIWSYTPIKKERPEAPPVQLEFDF